MERRLAAILAADVVGYSRLTEVDEEGTLRRLKALRSDLLEPKISEHHGRLIKFMGDGLLAEFASVVDAVRCAVDIQRSMTIESQQDPEGEKIALRIGLNLGDIVFEDDDVYGDGVNVAARLEGLAEPGGILLSGTAFDHVKTKLDVEFERLGKHRVKNIREPVRVYRVSIDGTAKQNLFSGRLWLRGNRPLVALAAVILLAGVAVFYFWQPLRSAMQGPGAEQALRALPDKPSIAVLPFTNISPNPEQEYFADGITEDLITDLSKISGLFVIARNSTFAYKGKSVDLRKVAQELGVRYVLEGSVRRAGGQVRINAQLIDAKSGTHLWADRYDADFADVFLLQDRVTEQIVKALRVNISPSELARKDQSETSNRQAYDAFLRGWAYYRRNTPEDLAAAIPYFERALALDPGYARAHAALAAIYWQAAEEKEKTGHPGLWLRTMGISYEEIRRRGNEHLEAALEDPTPLAYQVASGLHSRQGRHDEAMAKAERAIELDPNNPVGYEALAKALIYAGRPAEASRAIDEAMRLDPNFPASYLLWLGLAEFGQDEYVEAVATLRRALQRNPDEDAALVVLTAALGHMGETEEAQSSFAALNDLRTNRKSFLDEHDEGIRAGVDSLLLGPYTLKDVDFWPFNERSDRERLRRGLELAGVPEEVQEKLSPTSVAGAITIDAEDAKKLLDQGVVFVDVRTLEVWKLGHIPGAKLLDLKTDFAEEKLGALVSRDQKVVIYCEGPTCLRSSKACAMAVSWGFKKVHYFRGGFPAWRAAGYSIAVEQ